MDIKPSSRNANEIMDGWVEAQTDVALISVLGASKFMRSTIGRLTRVAERYIQHHADTEDTIVDHQQFALSSVRLFDCPVVVLTDPVIGGFQIWLIEVKEDGELSSFLGKFTN